MTSDSFAVAHRASIILAAARNNVPAVYFASTGGVLNTCLHVSATQTGTELRRFNQSKHPPVCRLQGGVDGRQTA